MLSVGPDPVWSIFRAPPRYTARSPWRPVSAIAAGVAVLLICNFLLPLGIYELSPTIYSGISTQAGPPKFWGSSLSPAFSFIQQVSLIGLVWLISGMRGGIRSTVLALNPVSGGARTYFLLASGAFDFCSRCLLPSIFCH